jgi:kinesin family protein 13
LKLLQSGGDDGDDQNDKSEEEAERYESLCKQLVDLGEEQAAIDAPTDNSGLPGSTIEWKPPENTEEHVPILFLDLDYDHDDNEDDDDYSSSSSSSSSSSEEEDDAHKRTKKICGKDCHLKSEQSDHKFVDLKLLQQQDTVVVRSDFIYDSNGKNRSSSNNSCVSALASWDSSVHQSPYLNQLTPIDKHVYVTVRVNVRFKLASSSSSKNKFVELVLRKRLSVCVYLQASGPKLMSLNRFKNLLNPVGMSSRKSVNTSDSSKEARGASQPSSTCVIYRIISSIPKLLTEIENRESLAIKAASCLADESNQDVTNTDLNSASHFERYAKTIEVVDSILRREKLQQRLHLERTIHLSKFPDQQQQQQIEHEESNHGFMSPKTFSVPNLIKNGFGSMKNLANLYNNKQQNSGSPLKDVSNATISPLVDSPLKKAPSTENSEDENHENSQMTTNEPKDELESKPPISSTSKEIFALYNSINKENISIEPTVNSEEAKKIENLIFQDLVQNNNEPPMPNEDMTLDAAKSVTNLNRADSNQSIASTLTNSSQITTHKSKKISDFIEEEELPEWLVMNAQVIVSTNSVTNKPGFIRYIGGTKFASGTWIGVELEQAQGKNDGSLKGVRYFNCEENRGVFVRSDKLTLVANKPI